MGAGTGTGCELRSFTRGGYWYGEFRGGQSTGITATAVAWWDAITGSYRRIHHFFEATINCRRLDPSPCYFGCRLSRASFPPQVKFDLLSVCKFCDDSHLAVFCPRHRQRRGGSGGHKDGDEREGGQVHGGGEGAGLHEWGSILPSPGDAVSRRSRDSDSRKGGGHRAADGGVWGGLAFWVGKGIGAWELQTKGMRAREVNYGA